MSEYFNHYLLKFTYTKEYIGAAALSDGELPTLTDNVSCSLEGQLYYGLIMV